MKVWTVVGLVMALCATAGCDKENKAPEKPAGTAADVQAKAPKATTAQTKPAIPEPARPDATNRPVEPAKAPSAKAKPAKVEPAKVEPAKVEPTKPEATNEPVEAAKPVAAKPKAPGADALSSCRLMRHATPSAMKGTLVPTFAAAAKQLDPKNKAIIDDATAKKEACGDEKSPCGPAKAVSLLYDADDFSQVVLVKRVGGDGYWLFTDVWETYETAVTHIVEPLGDVVRVGVNVPLYERVPYCPDEDNPDDCATATAEVGSHHTDHVIDPKSGTGIWTAFCEADEAESGTDTKITRNGDRYTYTACSGDATAVTFTTAHLATCPSPDENKAFEIKRLINLGRAATSGKRYDEAIKHFDAALKLDDMSANARAERGYTLYKAGKLKAAKEDLESALFKAPASKKKFLGAVYYNLGLVAEAAKDKKAALQAFSKSVENRPNKHVQKKLDALKK